MKLREMTMKAGNLSYNLKRFFDKYVITFHEDHSYEHVGDIEKFQVYKFPEDEWFIYLLMEKETGVAFFEVKTDTDYDAKLINVAYIDNKFRGQNVLEKFIWFLKRHEKSPKIMIGDVHSEMMVPAIKKLSKKFKTHWVKDDKKIEYDPEKIDDFYGIGHSTGWLVMFENEGNFESWPRFFNEKSPDFRQLYDWLLE
jgi:hypothetical protein